MYICIAQIRKNTSNALSTKREQQANRWVFRVRRNCSGPTAGLCRLLGSEFQTVGPAEAKERQPKVLHRTRGTVSCWRIAGAGDRQHRTLERSSQ